MAIDKKTMQTVHELNNYIHENSSQYYHTRPIVTSEHGIILSDKTRHSFEFEYDIKDLFTIGALTQSSILMTGGTDSGKTTLAKLIMNSLFGAEEEGWHRIDVDTDFSKDAVADVDFSIIAEGKKLSEGLYKKMGFLGLPGLILDEINRAHSALGNKLLHVFDKDISLPDGSRAKIGVPFENGDTYQFQITAINEGSDYTGTFDMDKALRRRTIIEIPMDIFTPTPFDRLCIQKHGDKNIEFKNKFNNLEKILGVYKGIGRNLPLHPTAEMFVAYLEAFDYCKHSLTGEKGGVASRNGSVNYICSQPIETSGMSFGGGMGCEFLRAFENELCPYVRGITPGISKNLISVARGFALLRATKFVEMISGYINGEDQKLLSYRIKNPTRFKQSLQKYVGETPSILSEKLEKEVQKESGGLSKRELAKSAISKYLGSLEVEKEDIESALGFVAYSKIGIVPSWVLKYHQGNRYEAIKSFSRQAGAKFEQGLVALGLENLDKILKREVPEEKMQEIMSYGKSENPWLLRALTPYIENNKTKQIGKSEIQEFYEG